MSVVCMDIRYEFIGKAPSIAKDRNIKSSGKAGRPADIQEQHYPQPTARGRKSERRDMQMNRCSTETTARFVFFAFMAIAIVICSSGCGGSSAVPPDPAVSWASSSRLSLPHTQITKAELDRKSTRL